jgi:hypothetical protein
MTVFIKKGSPVFKEKIPSLQVVRRNILILVGIFAIAHMPVYLLSLVIGRAGLSPVNFETTASESTIYPVLLDEIILFAGELAFAFTVLCCAFISENTIEGKSVGFVQVFRHGMEYFWKAFLTISPIILVKIFLSGTSSMLIASSACLALLFLFPILFLTIFELILVVSVSLRDVHGWEAYASCWILSKNNRWKLLSEYITSVIVIIVLACPLYLPIFLFFRSKIVELPLFTGIIGDLLYIWVIIEMVLRFLDIERNKTAPSEKNGAEAI